MPTPSHDPSGELPRKPAAPPPADPPERLTGFANFDAFAVVDGAHEEAIALAAYIYGLQSLCAAGQGSVKADDLFVIFNALGQATARVVRAIEIEHARH